MIALDWWKSKKMLGEIMSIPKILILTTLLLVALFAIACEDDSIPLTSTTPGLFADGLITLGPRLGLSMRVRPYGGAPYPEMDSATIADTTCSINRSQYWGPADYVCFVGFNQLSGTEPIYTRGDTAIVTVYSGARSGSCSIRLLDQNDDACSIIVSASDTAVTGGSEVGVVWNNVALAEWYAIDIERRHDSTGKIMDEYIYDFSKDTAYTVSTSLTDPGTYSLYITVIPMTGPDPSAARGNFDSDLVAGWLYSYGMSDQLYIRISDYGASSKISIDAPESGQVRSTEDVVRSVLVGLRN